MPIVTWSSMSVLLWLACDSLKQALALLVLLALAVSPFADHLLLGAHMRDQPLDRLGKIGHRRGGVAVGAAFLHCLPQPVQRLLQAGADSAGAARIVTGIFAHGGGKPVFQI